MKRIVKTLASIATITVIMSTNVTVQAAEISDIESTNSLSIDYCATTIKNTYKLNYPEQATIIDDIVNDISADPEFIHYFETEGATAFQIIEDSLNDVLNATPLMINTTSATNYSMFVPVINQLCYHPLTGAELHTYCGPACALQALIGNGKIANIAENQNSTKVYSVGNEMGTNENGTFIRELTTYMADYYSSNQITYKVKAFTRYTYDRAIDFVIYSLQNGAAPIIRIDDTSVLSYYNHEVFSHYVTISGVNLTNNTVTLVDPHYDPNFRGYHTISMNEFENLVNYNGWLSVLTDVPEGEYVYE